MSTRFDSELAQFHEFIGQRLGNAAADISPEEALDLWRAQQPASEEFGETVRALKEAFADMEAGDAGQPFDEFICELRQRRNLSTRP